MSCSNSALFNKVFLLLEDFRRNITKLTISYKVTAKHVNFTKLLFRMLLVFLTCAISVCFVVDTKKCVFRPITYSC